MDSVATERRVAHTLVLALLGELRANPGPCQELRALLNERETGARLLSPTEAAVRLGVHPKTLTRAAAAGRVVGALRVGRHWRFDPAELALESPYGASAEPPAVARFRAHPRGAAADAIRTGRPR
jgi:excisionase family DNA binding protein